MSQAINTLIITAFASIFAFGFIYLVRKEAKKLGERKYKKLKGNALLKQQLQ